MDWRIVNAVRSGAVTIQPGAKPPPETHEVGFSRQVIEAIASLIPKGIIADPVNVGGLPHYKGAPYKDSDGDGMPDDWENSYRLNPRDTTDAGLDTDGDGYTNIEEYLNGTDPTKFVDYTDLANNVDPLL